MSLFAHIETGYALDPHQDSSSAAYAARFNAGVTANWVIVSVPDGTQHGAKDNGDGTFANPTVAAPPRAPAPLSATAFQDLAWAALGGGTVGMARFNVILKACETGNDVLQAVFQRYEKADIFAKDQVAALTSIMVGANVMTSDERTAILTGWPNA